MHSENDTGIVRLPSGEYVNVQRLAALEFCKNWWDYPLDCLSAVKFGGRSKMDTDHMALVTNPYTLSFARLAGITVDGIDISFDQFVELFEGDVKTCCEAIKKANKCKASTVSYDRGVVFHFADGIAR